MTTKFILHGGFAKENTDEDNRSFYSEILKDTADNTHILLVPFAKDEDRVVSATRKVATEFKNVAQGKSLHIAVATRDAFLDQLTVADIVYFHGGVSAKLLETLKLFGDFSNYLNGKIVAGESAGANVLCSYFYSPHADQVFLGLGIVPVRIIPHYTDDKKDKLNGFGEGMETLLLPEYTFKILFR